MKKTYMVIAAAACTTLAAGPTNTFTPGVRTQVLSHNARPEHGKYADRLDRSLAEAVAMMVSRDPEQLVSKKADNYRRWFGVNWVFVEKGGETKAGDWTKASEARMKKFVDYGHRLGYFVGFYCLDGYTTAEDQGWDKGYNFGSKDRVAVRWQAVARAHADFISTDQLEEVAKMIRGSH